MGRDYWFKWETFLKESKQVKQKSISSCTRRGTAYLCKLSLGVSVSVKQLWSQNPQSWESRRRGIALHWICKPAIPLTHPVPAAFGTWAHLQCPVLLGGGNGWLVGERGGYSCWGLAQMVWNKRWGGEGKSFNESARYWGTHALGASLSSQVGDPLTQGAWLRLRGSVAIGSGLKWLFLIDLGFLWSFSFSRWGNSVSLENDAL